MKRLLVVTVLLAGAVPAEAQRAEQERRLQEELAAPRPIEAANSVWIDELTWMEVRDAVAGGKTAVIVPTGGIEQNGPYLATGKHNIILRGACEAIARRLGDALCAPTLAFVPEGNIEPASGHMRYPGTISLREETFRMVLDDIASSLRAHGFTEIFLIGDSGGNQAGLRATAAALNERWKGQGATAYYIPEFYDYEAVVQYMNQIGVVEPTDDGVHDSYWITSLMMTIDPAAVRYDERVRAGKAMVNGLSIAPKEKTIEVGRKLMEFRTEQTVRAIEAARKAAGHKH